MEFHCLETNFADRFLYYSPLEFQGAMRENRDQVVILQNYSSALQGIFQEVKIEETESEWVILRTNRQKNGLPAFHFIEDAPQPDLYISSITRIPQNNPILGLLEKQVSLDNFDESSEAEIISLLQQGHHANAEFVAVYNVGQGNANAICDFNGIPMFYFDLGGGCYRNARTYSRSLNYCFSYKPPILLSHWDTDHFQSAKMNKAYLAENWIVPNQKIGPVHFKFFLSITGTKLIWPHALTQIGFQWGIIERCRGQLKEKNHSGLAFTAELSPSFNYIRKVLLPADAAYIHIPSTNNNSYDGIVITHHGAEFDIGNVPVPYCRDFGANVLSYGKNNSYDHPRRMAVRSHIMSGWLKNKRRCTINGHIAMTTHMPVHGISCRGRICNLQITQAF